MKLGKRSRRAAAVTAAGLLISAAPALATTYVWNGGDVDDSNLSSPDNWGGTAPAGVNTDDLQFAGTTRLNPNVDLASPTIVHSVTFNSGSGAFTLTGNTLYFQGGGDAVTNSSTATQTFDNDLRVAGFRNFKANNGDLVVNGNVVVDSGASLFARGGKTVTLNGLITGAGSVSRTDNGTTIITNDNNSFTGTFGAAVGVVQINTIADAGVNSAAGAGSVIQLGQGNYGPTDNGTLRYTGATASTNRSIQMVSNGVYQTGNPLPFSGRPGIEVANAATTLTFNGNFTYAPGNSLGQWRLLGVGTGVINGNITTADAMLDKSGAGTWVLSGTNTYTGDTSVSAGDLRVNGSIVSNTTVKSGGTLSGDGSVAGVAVAAGGFLAPGAGGIGSLDVGGDATLAGTLKIELGAAGLADLLNTTGTLDISAATVDFSALAGLSGDYLFASYGTLAGTQFASVSHLPAGYTIDYSYGGNGIALVSAVPTPAALPAGLLGLGLVALRRRPAARG